ncbi:unnamed protein product [Phytophthora lilii]|uniref:Unnamed protein product n=1 Tax=Phytophthora lilii TaxID=2077276 RepID=A0A9W6YL49_9STRA|nr:unnamed protein product [Phytophthora lilii]
MMTLTGSNTTPVKFQIQVHNGNRATTTNASWIGNITNNDLRFRVNNSTSMILTTTGRLGLGTTSPSAPLHVPGSNSFVFGAGGTTVYRLRTDSGATESALGPITYSVAGIFGGYIACTAMAMTSDRRLKINIQSYPLERIKRLYDNCDTLPFTFRISKRKDKKYDAVFDDGRVVSFGGIKRNGEPYQQYRDSTPLRAFSKYDHGNIERNSDFIGDMDLSIIRNHTPLLGSQKLFFGNV